MKVAKWGNSLAVRLPAAVVDALELKEGDEIQLLPGDAGELKVLRRLTIEQLIERMRKYRGSLPADFKFDREEANER